MQKLLQSPPPVFTYSQQIENNTRQAPSGLFYMLVFYAASVLYLIPDDTIPHLKIFCPLLCAILLFELIDAKIKLYTIDLLLIGAITICSFFNLSFDKLADAFIISVLLLKCRKTKVLDRNFVLPMYFICIASTICQLLIYRKKDVVDIVTLSVGDPNFSGLLMLFFFYFCWKNRLKVGMILSLFTSVLFVSRAYFLALLLFFLFLGYEKISEKIKVKNNFIHFFFKKGRFILVVLFANICLLGLSVYFVHNVQVHKTYTSRTFNRIQNLNDSSNFKRFMANYKFIELVAKDPSIAVYGLPPKYNDDEKLRQLLDSEVVIHNSLLDFIAKRGSLFVIVYFLAFGRIINRVYSKENLKYIVPYLVYSLFLHATYNGPRIIFLFIVLALPEIHSKAKSKFKFNPPSWKLLT